MPEERRLLSFSSGVEYIILPVEPGVHGLLPAVLPTAGLLKLAIPEVKSLPIPGGGVLGPRLKDNPGGAVLGGLLNFLALAIAAALWSSNLRLILGGAITMFLRICQVTCSR